MSQPINYPLPHYEMTPVCDGAVIIYEVTVNDIEITEDWLEIN